MPFSTPTAARTTAFRVTAAIVVIDLVGFLVGTVPLSAAILFNAIALVGALWLFSLRADNADQRARDLKHEGRRLLADHIKFAQELAASITHHPAEGTDAQLIRVEIVHLFFAHASRLEISEQEMEALLRDTDPIVIADVVASLAKHHSPLLDEHVPWADLVMGFAKRHSTLCHRPIDHLAWNRSLPPERALPEA